LVESGRRRSERLQTLVHSHIGQSSEYALLVGALAEVAWHAGDADRAARLLGAAARLPAPDSSEFPLGIQPDPARATAAVREALGEARFAAAYAEGRAMTLNQALQYALESSAEGG
jgi:hypothetical protein